VLLLSIVSDESTGAALQKHTTQIRA